MTFNVGSNPVKLDELDISKSTVPPRTAAIMVCALPSVLSGNKVSLISPLVFSFSSSLNFCAAAC